MPKGKSAHSHQTRQVQKMKSKHTQAKATQNDVTTSLILLLLSIHVTLRYLQHLRQEMRITQNHWLTSWIRIRIFRMHLVPYLMLMKSWGSIPNRTQLCLRVRNQFARLWQQCIALCNHHRDLWQQLLSLLRLILGRWNHLP